VGLPGSVAPARPGRSAAIHHDKCIVVDGRTVEAGSFNYTQAAARSNSENVLVIWNDLQVAARYLGHWRSRGAQAIESKE
jgi:phosphatidylserine/phosphatidylglycerophosphate/cardiolipin synthase-like enzyme